MIRILYVTWGEVPRMSSVYGGQVVRVVSALQQHPSISSAQLLAGYPIIHSGLVREKHKYGEQIKKIENIIGSSSFLRRRLPVPPVGIYPTFWQMPSFFFGQLDYFAKVIQDNKPSIVQCRSYLATYLAILVRRQYAFKYKVVFDARSLLPEEAAQTGRWALNSKTFNKWKVFEKQLLEEADLSLAVSAPMKRWFDDIGAKRTELIYLNVDTGEIDEVQMKDTSRIEAKSPILVYAGSLAEGSWHEPSNLWKVFASFRSFVPNARLLVVTKSDHAKLKSNISNCGFDNILESVTFTSASSPREVVQNMLQADFGIFSYKDPATQQQRAHAEAVFATKTAEYLCAGLPVIVNNVCGGARDYVKHKNAGIAYDSNRLLTREDIDTLMVLALKRTEISRKTHSDFSVTENANRLVKLYQELLDD